MEKTKKLVIFGAGMFADIAYEYFNHDSSYQVVGFAVEQPYLKTATMRGLPVVAIEEVAIHFPPVDYFVFVAIVDNQLNRLRTRLMQLAERSGYSLASYVSSRAFVWHNATLGKHCFIFEANVIQPFVTIGDNVILWSGNHIGHHSTIADNVFISSHVVVSGSCRVGANCFLGVNTAVADGVTIGDDCYINMSTSVTRSLEPNKMYRGQPAAAYRDNALAFLAESAVA